MRPKSGLALLLALLVLTPAVRADEDPANEAELAYARAQILGRASESVDPSRREAGNLDELKATIEARREAYQQRQPEILAEADRLLGRDKKDGLIQQAAILFRWIEGNVDDTPILKYEDPTGKKQAIDHNAKAAPDADTLAAWALVVDPSSDGTVRTKRIDALRTVSGDLAALALTDPEELTLWINRPWVAARETQVTARKQAYEADRPAKGLVSERTVSRKEARAQALRKQVEAYEALRGRSLGALDRLVLEEERLLEEAGRLGFEIEEARRAATAAKDGEEPPREGEPPDEAARAEARRVLDDLQLREIVGEQRLRLLYIAVRRAGLRQALYVDAIEQAATEALAAEDAHKAYEAELNRMRREQQMAQLAYEEKELRKRHDTAEANAKEDGRADRAIWAAYQEALSALMVVNATTREAVRLRRSLESKTRGGAGPEVKVPTDVCAPPPTAVAEDEAQAQVTAAASADPEDKDILRAFREPRPATMTANYVLSARELLDEADWGPLLTAQHYDAVDTRIKGLESALAGAGEAAEIEQRLEEARLGAEKALASVEEQARQSDDAGTWMQWYYPVRRARSRFLVRTVDAFEETLRGIREESVRVGEDLDVLRDYRTRLLALEERSFLISVDRTLDGGNLGAVTDDVAGAMRDASRWITLQGDEHAGTFVKRHWLALLGGLALIVVSFLFVRFGRKGLDRALRTLASRVPALRAEPVTVRAEEAQARRAQAVQEAAAKAAEQEALREVSKEEAARPQKMGEGGYGGEDDA